MIAERIAREGMRDLVAAGFADEARQILDQGGPAALAREMPDAWLDEITVSGTPEQCLAAIDRLGKAGTTRVVLVPPADADMPTLSSWCTTLAAAAKIPDRRAWIGRRAERGPDNVLALRTRSHPSPGRRRGPPWPAVHQSSDVYQAGHDDPALHFDSLG